MADKPLLDLEEALEIAKQFLKENGYDERLEFDRILVIVDFDSDYNVNSFEWNFVRDHVDGKILPLIVGVMDGTRVSRIVPQ